MPISSIKKFIVGVPLSTDRVIAERLSKKKALAIFSSDALSSVSYATEEILLMLALAPVAANAFPWSWPVALAIIGLLVIVVASYRQLINAYPLGGGAYAVAKDNLGDNMSLMVGAALLIDYILTVTVSVAAGSAAVTSAFPEWSEHKVMIAMVAIGILIVINLRGIRESGVVLAIPTYVFVFTMGAMFLWLPFVDPSTVTQEKMPLFPTALEGVGLWVVLRAFSSGCAALTGVEAISDGVMSFKRPEKDNAKITMVWLAALLSGLFLGVTYFSHVFYIVPRPHETVLSQLARVTGNLPFYYLVQASTASVLFLAANTSFNGFPTITSLLADDRFLPRQLASRGDRLVYSNGIIILGLISMFLIWLFNADVHLLIPMYAIGVFLCFTIAQAGMVKHWLKHRGQHWQRSMTINAVGCATTFVVLMVLLFTKILSGGWIIVVMLPALVLLFRNVKYHYLLVGNQLRLVGPPPPVPKIPAHHVIIPVSGIHRGVVEALHYARSISRDITACYISITPRTTERIVGEWDRYGMGVPLKILPSPFRSVTRPLLEYIEEELRLRPEDMITVIIPEFVTAKWWQTILHNQTALIIRAALAFKKRVVVTSVRYHLNR